jgi:hypothetical protein
MAQLNPSIFPKETLEENDRKMSRPLDQAPAVHGGLGATTSKETRCQVTHK